MTRKCSLITVQLSEMGWKYTVERLKKNPNVAHIHNSILVECICGKRVVLHRAYEETNLTKHLQNGCNLKNNIMLQVKFVYFYQV